MALGTSLGSLLGSALREVVGDRVGAVSRAVGGAKGEAKTTAAVGEAEVCPGVEALVGDPVPVQVDFVVQATEAYVAPGA